jgi:hypothetical protein
MGLQKSVSCHFLDVRYLLVVKFYIFLCMDGSFYDLNKGVFIVIFKMTLRYFTSLGTTSSKMYDASS